MTNPVERPQDGLQVVPPHPPHGEGPSEPVELTDAKARPHEGLAAVPSPDTCAPALPDPGAAEQAVQQLRAAGFAEDQQAALTTAFLRVLALWTQQATRDDVQTALQTGEQRLTQQLDTWQETVRRDIEHHAAALREDLRREVAQHAEALRAELHSALAQQAERLQTPRATPARRWDGPLWLLLALLGLTCAGVLVLVARQVLGG